MVPVMKRLFPRGPYIVTVEYIPPHAEGVACFQMSATFPPAESLAGRTAYPGESEVHVFLGSWSVDRHTVPSLNTLAGDSADGLLQLLFERRRELQALTRRTAHQDYWLRAVGHLIEATR